MAALAINVAESVEEIRAIRLRGDRRTDYFALPGGEDRYMSLAIVMAGYVAPDARASMSAYVHLAYSAILSRPFGARRAWGSA